MVSKLAQKLYAVACPNLRAHVTINLVESVLKGHACSSEMKRH
ncbi:hypothetical protein NPIL_382011, partial [Nephila pilipes]